MTACVGSPKISTAGVKISTSTLALLAAFCISVEQTTFTQHQSASSDQGCINRSILPSGMGARGVSSEHLENMEMFSGSPLRCSPVLQLICAQVLGEPCSGSRRTVLRFSENRALVLGEPCTIVTRHASIKVT